MKKGRFRLGMWVCDAGDGMREHCVQKLVTVGDRKGNVFYTCRVKFVVCAGCAYLETGDRKKKPVQEQAKQRHRAGRIV